MDTGVGRPPPTAYFFFTHVRSHFAEQNSAPISFLPGNKKIIWVGIMTTPTVKRYDREGDRIEKRVSASHGGHPQMLSKKMGLKVLRLFLAKALTDT